MANEASAPTWDEIKQMAAETFPNLTQAEQLAQFFATKEGRRIYMLINKLNGTIGTPASRADIRKQIDVEAQTIRKNGQTAEAAMAEFLGTPEGQSLYEAYRHAEGPDHEPEEPVQKQATKTMFSVGSDRVMELASEFNKEHPDLTPEQAVAKALNTNYKNSKFWFEWTSLPAHIAHAPLEEGIQKCARHPELRQWILNPYK